MKAVELFAGLGGFAQGAKPAGVRIVWAANHWQPACAAYRANHPEIEPSCQDLQQADFTEIESHDILLASPSCQGHCNARGTEKPHHDKERATAWAVVTCAEVHRPAGLMVENVPEFADWTLFPAWLAALKALGYALSLNFLDAADHGVPQHRRRLLVIGTRSQTPFDLKPVRREHVSFERIIDTEADRWSPVATKVIKTRKRVENGRRAFGARFLMPYYGSGSGLTGRSLSRPVGTITTCDRWALVDGDYMRMLNVLECQRAMGFPDSYRLPKNKKLAKHLLGNAVPPAMVTDALCDLKARL